LVNAASVAPSRSSRLRARCSANSGFFADDQPLAGKLGGGDLGQIAFVEQRELEGAGVEQGADLRGAQRGDPVEPGRAPGCRNDTDTTSAIAKRFETAA
jgi:hypothetical protein